VYEDVLHRRRDPLLVEQREDNELGARVFSIEPRAKKEIIVAWVAEVSTSNPITVPLRGLPKVGKLEVTRQNPSYGMTRISRRPKTSATAGGPAKTPTLTLTWPRRARITTTTTST